MRELRVQPGAHLGTAPDRASKELIAAGMRELGVPAKFIITHPFEFRHSYLVVSADWCAYGQLSEARAFIRGVLFALQPPEALADAVREARNDWARLQGRSGQAVQVWAFPCGEPSCVVVGSVRGADQGRAWATLVQAGWTCDALRFYCPDHATVAEEVAA